MTLPYFKEDKGYETGLQKWSTAKQEIVDIERGRRG